MAISMGIGPLGSPNSCILRKFRWMLTIDGVAGLSSSSSTNILPPNKAARPSLSFREMEAQHLNETIYFPGKPEWKPLNVTLYGLKTNSNPVFDWITELYDINGQSDTTYNYPVDNGFIINQITLEMLSACGDTVEEWIYEDCWLQNIDFGDLDMSDSSVANVDLTIRYARAYIATN